MRGADPTGGGQLKPEEIQAQLEAILKSATFQRSERLQQFLRFVCETALRGEASQLHEYLIGSEVFARGPEYSPHEDGIVRRQAHALRRKLQEYYEKEGASDPIRIELPLGRYIPVFQACKPKEPSPAVAPAAAPPTPAAPLGVRVWIAAGIGLGFLLFAAGWLAGRQAAPERPAAAALLPPEAREIWGTWLDSPEGAVLCFSNPLTAVVKHYKAPLAPDSLPVRLPLNAQQEKLFRSVVPLAPGGYLYFAPAISQAKMGEALSAVGLTSLFAAAGRPIRATQSRFVSWEDFTRNNIILLGHNEANPWLDELLKDRPYHLTMTGPDRQRAIVRGAAAGLPRKEFQIRYGDGALSATEEFALISMLPGVDAKHQLLLLNGLNTQATQMAAEYLTEPTRLRELLGDLHKRAPGHAGPWYFQAVVRTEVHDKVPTRAMIVELEIIAAEKRPG